MSASVRRVLIQRLEALGEFQERLDDSSMTQYERKQAFASGIPSDFVERRRDELQSKRYIHLLMLLLVVVGPVLALVQFVWFDPQTLSEMIAAPSGVAVALTVSALAVILGGGAYRIRGLVNYYRRREIYSVLHELDQASEDAASTEPAESSISVKDREPAAASVAG